MILYSEYTQFHTLLDWPFFFFFFFKETFNVTIIEKLENQHLKHEVYLEE